MKLYKNCISIGSSADLSTKENLYNIRLSLIKYDEIEKFKDLYKNYNNDYRRKMYPEIYDKHIYCFYSILGILENKTTKQLSYELGHKVQYIYCKVKSMIWFYRDSLYRPEDFKLMLGLYH